LRGNGPVAVETASSSLKGRMMGADDVCKPGDDQKK